MGMKGLLPALLISSAAFAGIDGCGCDPADARTMQARECSLTREAVSQAPQPPVFFLKDINPTKPNRWLALPRAVRRDVHTLADMTPPERSALWTSAITKAKELWNGDWGLAVNADDSRTQCQPHVHVGRLLEGVETKDFVVVAGPDQIPLPRQGGGLWVHPENGKLHVHLGDQIAEAVLLR